MTTWTKCADQMPPNDATEIILRFGGDCLLRTEGYDLHENIIDDCYEWTPYTKELWKELKK